MKSILVVSASKIYGGGEKVIANVFFSIENNYNIFYAVRNEELYSQCNKENRILLSSSRRESIKLINQYIIDNAISTVIFNGNSALSLFIKCKFKIAYKHSGWRSIDSYVNVFLYFFVINISYLFCDKIIIVSKSIKPLFLWEYKTVIINNGIDIDYFIPNKKTNKVPKLIFTGRVHYQKGVFELYDVIKKLSLSHKFDMVFVGDGPSLNKLRLKTKEDKLEKVIQFSGFSNNVRKELLNSDIFILPSYNEACSLSLLEAMSSELAIVVSNKGGSKTIISHGINGLIIDPFNKLDLYMNIGSLINNKAYRKKLGVKARETISENFTLKKSIQQIKETINSIHETHTTI